MKDFKKYIEYIKNTGDICKKEWFIYDWEPIGETLIIEMLHPDTDLIYLIKENDTVYIKLTEKGMLL